MISHYYYQHLAFSRWPMNICPPINQIALCTDWKDEDAIPIQRHRKLLVCVLVLLLSLDSSLLCIRCPVGFITSHPLPYYSPPTRPPHLLCILPQASIARLDICFCNSLFFKDAFQFLISVSTNFCWYFCSQLQERPFRSLSWPQD